MFNATLTFIYLELKESKRREKINLPEKVHIPLFFVFLQNACANTLFCNVFVSGDECWLGN